MSEVDEIKSTPKPVDAAPNPPDATANTAPAPQKLPASASTRLAAITIPPPQFNPTPIQTPQVVNSAAPTPRIKSAARSRNITPRFLTPLGSPLRKALKLTKLDPQDAWLPITESRNGNAYYAAFHTLCSGIGIQALVLPVAFTTLGWAWGIIILTLLFTWQIYSLYILVHLHESPKTGIRYSRYMTLARAAFGDRLGKLLAMFPIIYLSVGTCSALIIIGGGTCKTFFQIVCGPGCTVKPLTSVEWYLIFTCAAVLLSQLPNLNSIAGISLIGAITAVGYCTVIWVVSVSKGRIPNVSYNPVSAHAQVTHVFDVLNAIGIVAFAFRGNNLILEIQGTMPSDEKHPSTVPMWTGVKFSYSLIAMCLFPLAIGGYWAYGSLIPANGGMLAALIIFHGQDTAQWVLGLTSLFVIINSLSSFQIYGMPTFDDMEAIYVRKFKKPCTWWMRGCSRALFAFACFFTSVAFPFLGSMAGLVGGLALPVTFSYPCFMWLLIKKPKVYSKIWFLNWGLGIIGSLLSVLLSAAGVYVVIQTGIKISFFNPQ